MEQLQSELKGFKATDKNTSCFGYTYTHLGDTVIRDHVVFSLVHQLGAQTAKQMEKARAFHLYGCW